MKGGIKQVHEVNWKIKNFNKNVLETYKEQNKDFERKTESFFPQCLHYKASRWNITLRVEGNELKIFPVVYERKHFFKEEPCKFFIVSGNESLAIEGTQNLGVIKMADIFDKPNFVQDDVLHLRIQIKIYHELEEGDSYDEECNDQPCCVCKSFFNSTKFSDFTFICSDGIEIPAHRIILAQRSPVIDAMLSAPMTENLNKTANIEDINGETMLEILRFIYTGKVENAQKLAPKLLYGAEKYELCKIKQLCIKSMITNLSVENALNYLILGERYKSCELMEKSAEFIEDNYKKLKKHDDWLRIDGKLYTYLLDYFHSSYKSVYYFETTIPEMSTTSTFFDNVSSSSLLSDKGESDES